MIHPIVNIDGNSIESATATEYLNKNNFKFPNSNMKGDIKDLYDNRILKEFLAFNKEMNYKYL